MKIPSKVKVAGVDVLIKASTSLMESSGAYLEDESVIFINVKQPCKYMVLDTFLHEISHAIYTTYNIQDDDKEEDVVRVMGTAWTQIYRDNPDVLAFINEICKQ